MNAEEESQVVAEQGTPWGPWATVGFSLIITAIYLATAPKSNRIYDAYNTVRADIKQSGALPVPLHIRNAPTRLMRDLGYAKGYKYAHDYRQGYTPQDYLPQKLKGRIYYRPTDRGYEKIIKARLDRWRGLKKSQNG